MLEPARIIELIEKRRVEWALEGVRYPNRDARPEFTLGTLVGRDEAAAMILEDVKNMISEEEDRDKER